MTKGSGLYCSFRWVAVLPIRRLYSPASCRVTAVPLVEGTECLTYWHQAWPQDSLRPIKCGQRDAASSEPGKRPQQGSLPFSPATVRAHPSHGAVPSAWSPDWSHMVQSHSWLQPAQNISEINLGCFKSLKFQGSYCYITCHKLTDTQGDYYEVSQDCYHPVFSTHNVASILQPN